MNDAMNCSHDALNAQLHHCISAIKRLDHAMKKQHWDRLHKHSRDISSEMESLKLLLVDYPNMDEETTNQLRYLDIQMRRVQRQLMLHIRLVESDVSTLDYGIKRSETIRSMLKT